LCLIKIKKKILVKRKEVKVMAELTNADVVDVLVEVYENTPEKLESIILFSEPEFADAIIGVDEKDRIVYNFSLMVNQLMNDNNMSEEDAIEYLNTNTIPSMDDMGDRAPIIVYDLFEPAE
jgi:replication-associated recombination protein RarA